MLFSTTKLWCQQDPKFTLFNYNYTYINPAASGSKEQLSVWLLHRQQWVGYKGAPQTSTFCFDMPLVKLRSSIALNMMQESIGLTNTLFGGLSYAIIAHTGIYSRLSFGIQLGINQIRTLYSNGNTDPTNTQMSNDEALNYGQNITHYAPHIGTGVFYYNRKFKLGISVPTLNYYNYFGAGTGLKQPHFFIVSGINFAINNSIFYNPRLLVKVTMNAPIQFDLYNQFILNEKLAVGFTLRSSEALALVLCYSFNKQFNIAYAYDLVVLNKLRKYQTGSHELSLNYLLPLKHIEKAHKRLRAGRRQKCIDFDDESKKRLKLYKEIENVFYDKN